MASDTNAGIGLLGQYYDNADLTGLALSRVDANINFNWGTGSPSALIGADTFSVRWSGQIEAIYTEQVNFFVNADDGVRLWVDGQLLIDRWSSTPVVNATGTIPMIAGRKYDLQLEYFENTNSAAVSLEWSSASQPRSIVPTTRLFPSERGSILKETWAGLAGASVASLTSYAQYPNSPSTVSLLGSFELVSNVADNYGDRLRGQLFAPTTGEYTFYLSGDETAELWLSNSSGSANKQLIASVPSPTLAREWTKFPSQRSSVLNLVAGQSYYIEALHKDATGSDHLAVAWTRPGQSSIDVIDGQYLAAVLPTVSIYSDSPVAGEGSGGPARISVVRSGTSTTNSLTVSYTVRGTAINGTDYTNLPGSVVIPAGQSSVSFDIAAISDSLTEGTETVTIELLDASGYEVDRLSQRTANVTIQDNTNAPAGGVSLLAGTTLSSFSSFGGTFSTVTDPIQGNVIQAAITSQQSSPFNSQLRQSINGPIANGDILYFEFYVRSVTASGNITAIFETNASPFTKSLDQGVLVTQTWSRVQLPFLAAGDYTAGQAAVGFHLGSQIQTLQFYGFQLLKYGPSSKLESATGISLQNIGGSFGTMQTVAVTGQTFTSATQIDTTSTPANGESWRLQGLNVSAAPVVTGDVLQFDFWVRGVAGANPRIGIAVQESFGSFVTLYFNQISLTNNWQKISFSLAVTRDYAKNNLQITFNAGFTPQSIQIADFTWRNTTRGVDFNALPNRTATATYAGRSGTDTWRSDADARINANRMGNLTVNVTDSNGSPINGAVVQLRQKKQDFKFGTAVSGYDNLLSGTTTEALKYQSEIKRLFNTVVVENNLKWPDFLNNRTLGIDSANWAVNNGLYLRGHNIVWPSRDYVPASVWSQYDSILASQGATAAANYLRTTVRDRVADAASTLRGIAGEWDVVNEPYANHDVMDILGNDELLEWFRIYRANDPTGKRVLNDYDIFARNGGNTDHRTNFAYWLGRLTNPDGNAATPDSLIEVMGEQSHYSESNLTDMVVLGQLIQSYSSTYNLPIAITEFDVNTKNEQLQADYLRDYLTMLYSQPAVTEFLQWGFWSKSHWLPDAALFRSDFSIKPNGQAYEDLVFGDWWSVTRGTTRGGQVQSKVFTGDFDVVVTWNGQTISSIATLGLAGNAVNVVIPNFHVPTDILLSNSTILENDAINSVVGTLSAVDSDASSSFVYSLVSGSGSIDNASFNLSGNSLRASSSFDFEAKSVYSVRVRATDQTGLATERVLQITVVDVNEAPNIAASQSSIAGNVLSEFSNTGTWSDPEGNTVTLTASLGTVVKNANGTWDWSYTPTTKLVNQAVTITANDGTNTSTVSFTITANVAISQRGLFYGGASGSSASTFLATDKSPLLPGQSSTFGNYTNYSLGLNGVVVDVAGLPASTTDVEMLASLQFSQWDGISATGFTGLSLAAVPTVSILTGSGTGGSTRVRITFPDNTVENTWLRIVVVANAQTGLASNDVFYFGNVIGDLGVGNTAGSSGRIRVSIQDTTAVRDNQSPLPDSVDVTNIYDLNRDGRVSVQDTAVVRNNQQPLGIVAPITAPSARPAAGQGSLDSSGSTVNGNDDESSQGTASQNAAASGSDQMPSGIPSSQSVAGGAVKLSPTIGWRWTGESYHVPRAELVSVDNGFPEPNEKLRVLEQTILPEVSTKKKRTEDATGLGQLDNFFACLASEFEDF